MKEIQVDPKLQALVNRLTDETFSEIQAECDEINENIGIEPLKLNATHRKLVYRGVIAGIKANLIKLL